MSDEEKEICRVADLQLAAKNKNKGMKGGNKEEFTAKETQNKNKGKDKSDDDDEYEEDDLGIWGEESTESSYKSNVLKDLIGVNRDIVRWLIDQHPAGECKVIHLMSWRMIWHLLVQYKILVLLYRPCIQLSVPYHSHNHHTNNDLPSMPYTHTHMPSLLPAALLYMNNFHATPVETVLEKTKAVKTKVKQVMVFGLYDDPPVRACVCVCIVVCDGV